MSEFPRYKPDGCWSALFDAVRAIETSGDLHPELLIRLARQFELLGDQRTDDLARLFRVLAWIGQEREYVDLRDEEDEEDREARPLAGE